MKTTQSDNLPMRFDTDRVVKAQIRAINRNADGADFLVEYLAHDISHRVSATNRQFGNCIDLCSLSNALTRQLHQLDNVEKITRYELPPIADHLNAEGDALISALRDGFKNNFGKPDLVVSIAGLHTQNNLPELFQSLKKSMKKDGLFLIVLPVTGSLLELKTCLTLAELEIRDGATLRVDPFIDLQGAAGLLQQAGFKLPVVDREEVTVRYDNIFALIKDIRSMGANSTLVSNHPRYAGRDLFKRANEIYLEKFSDPDGRIRATFCFAFLTAWSPHENQPKPLKPGSAQISLAKHLNQTG